MEKMVNGKIVEMTAQEETDHLAQQEIDNTPSTDPNDYSLTPRQFHRFAAEWDYDLAIEAVLAGIRSIDKKQYAEIKGDMLGAKVFHFKEVRRLIDIKALSDLIPDGVDVTREKMAGRWILAAETKKAVN